MTRGAHHARAADIVAAARSCIGTRFRSQGRMPGLGLDCVGVVLVAARAAGTLVDALPRYQLGGDHGALVDAVIARAGLRPVSLAAPGDVWLFAPAPGLRHLAVQSSAARRGDRAPPLLIHAHAGVGRTVEAPADPAWAVLGRFRFSEGD